MNKRFCEICGKRIRTGLKYCYECKNPSAHKRIEERKKKEIDEIIKEQNQFQEFISSCSKRKIKKMYKKRGKVRVEWK